MAVLIDTSTLIEAERRRWSPQSVQALAPGEPLGIATVTVSELLVGIYRGNPPAQRVRRERFARGLIEAVAVLPFDLAVAEVHAQLWAGLANSGTLIGAHDLIIAATALAHGHSLLTENVAHFHTVPGLDVRQPRWTP